MEAEPKNNAPSVDITAQEYTGFILCHMRTSDAKDKTLTDERGRPCWRGGKVMQQVLGAGVCTLKNAANIVAISITMRGKEQSAWLLGITPDGKKEIITLEELATAFPEVFARIAGEIEHIVEKRHPKNAGKYKRIADALKNRVKS